MVDDRALPVSRDFQSERSLKAGSVLARWRAGISSAIAMSSTVRGTCRVVNQYRDTAAERTSTFEIRPTSA